MNLKHAIRQALDVTARLDAALALGDLELIEDLLELRGTVMAEFGMQHDAASDTERSNLIDQIESLADADRRLQAKARANLDEVALQLRTSADSVRCSVSRYGSDSGIGCVDRKA